MAGFIQKHTVCGLCGKRTLAVTRKRVKDGVICPECKKWLRPAFPKYQDYRRLTIFDADYDSENPHETALTWIDPLDDETIESLRPHRFPPKYIAEEREAAPMEDKDSYTVVLTNIRRGQAVPVTKAVVSACGIPMEKAWDISDRLPITLGTGIARSEALRWKRLIETEGAVVDLR